MHYSLAIPADGTLRMPVAGSLLLLTDIGANTSVDAVVNINGRSPFRTPKVKRGFRAYFRADTFSGVEITGIAGSIVDFIIADVDVQISTTDGAAVTVPGGVLVTNPVGSPVPVDILGATLTATDVGTLSPGTLADFPDVAIAATATAIVAAAAAVGVKQREVIVKNLQANTAAFRIGAATAAAGRGAELQPGESLTLDTLAAVYAYNVGAAPQSISVITNTR